jgi:hypothetical protein
MAIFLSFHPSVRPFFRFEAQRKQTRGNGIEASSLIIIFFNRGAIG